MTLPRAAIEEPWEVFARHEAGQPIRHIGRVDASDVDDAMVFARTLYEEWRWLDMLIVRRAELITVVEPS